MDLNKRPTVATIHIDNLRHNAKQILKKVPDGQEVMAIVKANGYGHGSVMVTRALESCGIKKFGVATFTEGLELRKEGIRSEIHILDGIVGPLPEYLSNRLYPVIAQLEQLQDLSKFLSNEGREFMASLKFDTGMGRLGFSPSQVDDIFKILRKAEHLRIASILTHLSKADVGDEEHTKRQYTLFRKLRDILKERGLKGTKYSICNSAAIIDEKFEDFDWVRPGISLYGCYPNARQMKNIDLKPVLDLKTKIIHIKKLPPHSPVGYGGTFVTERETMLAILPIGYADGYPRLISNRGYTLVNGQKAPIVGRISMDLMSIDVTDIKDADLYETVTLIGQDGKELIRAEDLAEWAETIPYEIVCGITARVPRVYEGI